MMKAYRFELDPSNVAASALASHCGAARFAYNWGLALVKARLGQTDRIREDARCRGLSEREAEALARCVVVPWTAYGLRREWNRAKEAVAPWWRQNSKEAANTGLFALATGLRAWQDSTSGRRRGPSIGFPTFKRRGARRSCRFSTGSYGVVDARHIQLPRIGIVRTKEATGALLERLTTTTATILSATVSERAGRWYVSFGCEVIEEPAIPAHRRQIVGVDVGVRSLAVLSTGEVVANPKPLATHARRLARHQRRLARQRCGGRGSPASNRSRRTGARIARIHARVANCRGDALHKLTTALATAFATVVVEDLNVAGMTARPAPRPDPATPGHLRNGARAKAGLNRAIADASPAELRRQLTYKCAWYGSALVVADRFYPSSRTCSACGTVKAKLSLSERVFACDSCGLVIDRDLNAARNLAGLVSHLAASGAETQNGRRGERSQGGSPTRCSPVKRQAGTRKRDRTGTAASQGTAA